MLFTVEARSCSAVKMWTGHIRMLDSDSHLDSLGPSNTSPQLWKPKILWTFPMSPKGKISPNWEPPSKIVKRALDEFYKQGISSAEYVEEQWGRAEPLDSDEGRENGDGKQTLTLQAVIGAGRVEKIVAQWSWKSWSTGPWLKLFINSFKVVPNFNQWRIHSHIHIWKSTKLRRKWSISACIFCSKWERASIKQREYSDTCSRG